jgi:SOS-response transcriptional repressor LexA
METVDKKAFGRRVAERRKELKARYPSQAALAARVGMRQQGIDSIERGEVERPRKLRELAQALQTTQEWLLWRRGPKETSSIDATVELSRVPLLDWVSAGRLVEPRSQIPVEDVPLLAFADLGRGDFFALRVGGDSMDRVSPDGSVIVVNRADKTPVAGKPYVFSYRGEATYKLWHAEPPYLAPFSTNPAHQPIFVKNKRSLEIVGRVRRTLLDL